MSTWSKLLKKQKYIPIIRDQCLVVTATDDSYVEGAIGMIKSFCIRSGLHPTFIVLGKNLSTINKQVLESLPRTRVVPLDHHNARDHWCTWILELFWGFPEQK